MSVKEMVVTSTKVEAVDLITTYGESQAKQIYRNTMRCYYETFKERALEFGQARTALGDEVYSGIVNEAVGT